MARTASLAAAFLHGAVLDFVAYHDDITEP
jgi:hypothetical protein